MNELFYRTVSYVFLSRNGDGMDTRVKQEPLRPPEPNTL